MGCGHRLTHAHTHIAGQCEIEMGLEPGGKGDSYMKQTGMFVVSLRGVSFGFWSRLGYSG